MAGNEYTANDVLSPSQRMTPHSLVTEDLVRAALTTDKGAAARLIAWKVVDFTKEGDNYASVVTSVQVNYVLACHSCEAVYVVKINPLRELKHSLYDIIFEKEINVYLTLIPQINSILREIGHKELNFPKCFHACLEKGKQILFLEDLRPRGYKMVSSKCGMDEAHVTLVLRELARLHAASFLLQGSTPHQDFKAQHPYIQKDWHDIMHTREDTVTVFKTYLQFAKKIIDKLGGYEKVAAWIDNITLNLVDTFYEQLGCGEPKVVCHGDCWNNNLLFRYNEAGHPEDVMLLDLQVVRHAAPATDLSFFLFTSVTRDIRKPNTEAFLGSYYTTFSAIMEDAGQKMPFTRAQLLKDFRDKNTIGIMYGLMTLPQILVESEDLMNPSKDIVESNEIK